MIVGERTNKSWCIFEQFLFKHMHILRTVEYNLLEPPIALSFLNTPQSQINYFYKK